MDKFQFPQAVKELQRNYFGASLGVFAFQAITLASNPLLLANRTVISLTVGAAGAYMSQAAHGLDKKLPYEKDKEQTANKCKIFYVAFAANAILGALSIYYGRYSYGISALGFTAAFLNK
jgi:hypothetical protein